MEMNAKNISIGYGDNTIVKDLNLSIIPNKITSLIGANGSGKSTILKAMSRLIKINHGEIIIDGKNINELNTKYIAQKLAILPQNPFAQTGITVKDLVSYGRFPRQKGMGKLSKEDLKMIDWSLKVTGMLEFKDRYLDQLSGGQRQRAWISMALAQDTDFLFLDEPTTFLDMGHQLEVLKLLKKLNEDEKKTIVMVVHDLNHAARFSHNIIAIKKGEIVCNGTPEEVMREEIFEEVFGVKADIIYDPRTNVPLCLPYDVIF